MSGVWGALGGTINSYDANRGGRIAVEGDESMGAADQLTMKPIERETGSMARVFGFRRLLRIAFAAMIVVWVFSTRVEMYFRLSGGTAVHVVYGTIWVSRVVGSPADVQKTLSNPSWKTKAGVALPDVWVSKVLLTPFAWGFQLPRSIRSGVMQESYGFPIWILASSAAFVWLCVWLWPRRRVRPGHCRRCGYDLHLNESGQCPECGMRVERSEGKEKPVETG